ncbi:MAG: PSD1 and planctomycete cytochrome C domain-containing protein [Verrucomicrobiales bacterium]
MTKFSAHFVAIAALSWAGATRDVSAEVDFGTEIRPILTEKCLLCHGPDDEKGGLRLTGIDFAEKELDSGAIGILPGKPDQSALIERIHASDPDDVMPPPDKAEPLTDGEKAKLRQWIAEGATWPKHWAFAELSGFDAEGRPPKGEHPIDFFVRRGLEEKGIEPSPKADAATLVRRLFYDLVGLPPSPEQADRYLELLRKDREAGLAQLIDDLLASEHFGERWGRHWLDKARYADSDGYEKDNNRPDAWRYRDWVIDAINADMPFDRFTIEQFAGDLLEEPSPDQLLATAFNRQTLTNTEGGTDKEQWRVAAVMDRVETMGAVWMGLTLTCARCHTHKYDEVTHDEYYQLFAYFNNGDEVETKVPKSEEAWAAYERAAARHREKLEDVRTRAAAARGELAERMPEWEARAQRWLAEAEAVEDPVFTPLPVAEVAGPKGVKFNRAKDGTITAGGQNPPKATYTLSGRLEPGTVTGVRIEALPDPKLGGGKGPGRSKAGNFVLNQMNLSVAGTGRLVFAGAEADYSQGNWAVQNAIDGDAREGKDGTGWAISPEMGQAHEAVFGLARPVALEEAADFTLDLVQNYGSEHTLGKFRVTLLTTPTRLVLSEEAREALKKPASERDTAEQALLAAHFERIDPKTAPLLAQVHALESKPPAKPEMDVRILRERREDRRETHVFKRGEFKQPLGPVEPGTPAVLAPIEHRGGEGDRLDLARWLVSGENPLPPRVVANGIWANLFGEGLVATPDDFGVRGDRPSHPELLDWLAAEFVAQGWSRKELIRRIATSKTYRRSSDHRPDLADVDPNNRLLARQNRFRVEAEIVRDISLAAAGLLSDKIGGPSVFPPLPAGVADVNYNSAFKWVVSEDEDRYRRGMYTYFKRTAPHPNLTTFDCPDSNTTNVQRSRSNTPLAALITLNNETFAEASRSMAERVLADLPEGDDRARIDRAFRLCLSRGPEAAESDRLASLLESARGWYREHPDEAALYAGDSAAGNVPAPEAAAWIATVRVVLNLDEFLTRN